MRERPVGRWVHLPLLVLTALALAPLAFMFTTALGEPGRTLRAEVSLLPMLIPQTWRWENFAEVWEKVSFLRYYLNSLVISLLVTFGQVLTSAMAAYAFARLEWPGRNRLFMAYLATLMIPGAVTMIPNFILMKSLPELFSGWFPFVDWLSLRHLTPDPASPLFGRWVGLDSYFALILPGMFSAYGTFLLRQFLLNQPRELEEAAEIDGCGHARIFFHITLPLAAPGVATLAIFTFMGSWGSFLWPLVTINHNELRTLPLGLQAFQGQYGTEWHLLMAAALLMLLPILVVFLAGQRFFLRGLMLGGVKG